MTQSDLFRSTSAFVFDGDPSGSGRAVPCAPTHGETPEPRHTMAAKAAALFRSRPNQWIDGREFAQVCGLYGWRTRISDVRRAPFLMDIENRQTKEGRYTISEYRWNAPVGDRL